MNSWMDAALPGGEVMESDVAAAYLADVQSDFWGRSECRFGSNALNPPTVAGEHISIWRALTNWYKS